MLQDLTKDCARDPDYLGPLLTEDQAARILGLSPRALQNWRVRGGGPLFVKIGKRCVRYRRCDLLEWIENQLCSSTSERTAGAG